jgi:hypothetical protein
VSRKRAYTKFSESDFLSYLERIKIQLESAEIRTLSDAINLILGSVRLAGVYIWMDEKENHTVLEFDYPGEISKREIAVFRFLWEFLQDDGIVTGGLKRLPKKAEKESEEKRVSPLKKELRTEYEIKNLTGSEKELAGLIYWNEYSRKGGELAYKFGTGYGKTLTKLFKKFGVENRGQGSDKRFLELFEAINSCVLDGSLSF